MLKTFILRHSLFTANPLFNFLFIAYYCLSIIFFRFTYSSDFSSARLSRSSLVTCSFKLFGYLINSSGIR